MMKYGILMFPTPHPVDVTVVARVVYLLAADKPTVGPSNNSARLLLYQSLPTSSALW
jgi:hypothetical protein